MSSGWITVTGSQTSDSSGNLVSNGTIAFQPSDGRGNAISFRAPGQTYGQATKSAVTAPITNGQFSITLPDVHLCQPQDIAFIVTITDNVSGDVILGPDGYLCQPSLQSYAAYWVSSNGVGNFDLFQPTYPSVAVMQNGAITPTTGVGPAGRDGTNGASAYDVAVANGFSGTQAQWLASLVGAAGKNGTNGSNGTNGTNGTNGAPGASAYQLAVANGFSGSETAWLASLVGEPGLNGTNGTNGKDGVSPTILIRSLNYSLPGTSATVTNAGTATNQILDLVVPLPTFAAETTVLAAGANPTVSVIVGTNSVIFDFGIPSGGSTTTNPGNPGSSTGAGLVLTDSYDSSTWYQYSDNGVWLWGTAVQSGAGTPVTSVTLIDYDTSGNATGSYTALAFYRGDPKWSTTTSGSGAVASAALEPDEQTGVVHSLKSIYGTVVVQ